MASLVSSEGRSRRSRGLLTLCPKTMTSVPGCVPNVCRTDIHGTILKIPDPARFNRPRDVQKTACPVRPFKQGAFFDDESSGVEPEEVDALTQDKIVVISHIGPLLRALNRRRRRKRSSKHQAQ